MISVGLLRKGGDYLIDLKVEPYCHNCTLFEVDVERDKNYANNELVSVDTTIFCKHRELCTTLKKYLEKEADK